MILKHNIDVFPFHAVPRGGTVVLYGMGRVGCQYIKQLLATKYCQVCYAVDVQVRSAAGLPVAIYPPDHIRKDQAFDYVVIALGDQSVAAHVRNQLVSWGIGLEKIVHSNHTYWDISNFSDEHVALPDANFFQRVRQLLRIGGAAGKSLVRVGNRHDGGYVMLDDFHHGGTAYSFGIGDEISWDTAMAQKGYDVFMYDHTIDALPEMRKGFHFSRMGISGSVTTNGMDTLEHFLARNRHDGKSGMILKMDIEGDEWEFLGAVLPRQLQQFDQVVMEMHGFLSVESSDKIIAGLQKLNETHFVVHVHANNFTSEIDQGNFRMADVLEVTWASRRCYQTEEIDVTLPLEIDSPCTEWVPEVKLGRWNDAVCSGEEAEQ